MNKITSNIAAGVTQATIVVAIIAAANTWHGNAMHLTPATMFLIFAALTVLMAVALGFSENLCKTIANKFGISAILTDVAGCAATMLFYGAIWLATGGLQQEFAFSAIALMTAGACLSGCVRYWVSRPNSATV